MAFFSFDFLRHGGVKRDGIDVETIANGLWLINKPRSIVPPQLIMLL